jgi:LSU ribosomal protein L12P
MAITKEDVLNYIENVSIIELNELIKSIEEKFGVKADQFAMAAPAAGGAPQLQLRHRLKKRRNSTSFLQMQVPIRFKLLKLSESLQVLD